MEGVERHQGCCATITGTAPASETQAESGRRRLLRRLQVRFLTGFLPFLTRQSPRPSHIQRAQLASWTSFRCWRPSLGQRHHLLRQVWSCLLGARGCSLPPMQRIPRGQNVAAAQIEVWAFSQLWTRLLLWWRSWNLARLVWVARSWDPPHLKGNRWPLRQRCLHTGESLEMLATTKTQRYSGSTSGGRSSGRRVGSTISWSQSSPSRLVVSALTRQTELAIQVWFHCPVQQRPKRDFGVMCAVGCDGSSSSESEAEPYNIWNALLAALVHFRIGEVLQPLLTSEEVGCVALSCHFACDAFCAGLYDWGSSRARLTSE